MEYSPPGSSIHGILQARTLEWVAVPSSRGSSQPRDQTQASHIAGRFFTIWATRETQEYWSGQPCPSPEDLPDQESSRGLLPCRRGLPVEPPGKPLHRWRLCAVLRCSGVSHPLWPRGLEPPRLLCPWGFSRQEYWHGWPCPPPQDLPNPGIKSRSPTLQVGSLPSEPYQVSSFSLTRLWRTLPTVVFAFLCSFPLRTPDIIHGLTEPGPPCVVQPAPSLTPFLLSLTRKLASLMVHFLTLLQLRVAVVTSEIQGKSLGRAFLPKSNRTDSPWDATCPAVSPFLPLGHGPSA